MMFMRDASLVFASTSGAFMLKRPNSIFRNK